METTMALDSTGRVQTTAVLESDLRSLGCYRVVARPGNRVTPYLASFANTGPW
jgi:hypothetical protein